MSTPTIDDGGPAFPVPAYQFEQYGSTLTVQPKDGMTLRDWFAGQALAGLASQSPLPESEEMTAQMCYEVADAMLAARKGKTT